MPAIQRSRVLLPLPFRPITAKNSPGWTSKETSRSASKWSWRKLATGWRMRAFSVQVRWRGTTNDFDTSLTRTEALPTDSGCLPDMIPADSLTPTTRRYRAPPHWDRDLLQLVRPGRPKMLAVVARFKWIHINYL